jgi:hypothetical protein
MGFTESLYLGSGVSEALVLDFAHLTVDRVSVEVHVAGHVVVDAGRVPGTCLTCLTRLSYLNCLSFHTRLSRRS